MGKNNTTDAEYPFDYREVIHYILARESIHTVTIKIQVTFLTRFPERMEIASGD
jgi:hypothetical protein